VRAVTALAALLLSALLSADANAQCSQQSLRVAVIPKKSMEALMVEFQPLLQRLTSTLHMPVELVAASSYESVVDAIVSGGVDIAWLGPASYILAYQREPRIEPFASLTINEGFFTPAGHHYQSLLMVRRDGPADVNAVRGEKVALSDPASTSGGIVPNGEFAAEIGQPLSRYFASLVYTGAHDKSLDALLDGRVGAAFVSSVQADGYLNSGKIKQGTLRVLWRSAPIFYDPYVFSANVCAPLKARIRTAMLSDPQALAEFLASQHASGIMPVSHADYAPLLEIMEKAAP